MVSFYLCHFLHYTILATRYCKEDGVWDDIVCQASEIFLTILTDLEVKLNYVSLFCN